MTCRAGKFYNMSWLNLPRLGEYYGCVNAARIRDEFTRKFLDKIIIEDIEIDVWCR